MKSKRQLIAAAKAIAAAVSPRRIWRTYRHSGVRRQGLRFLDRLSRAGGGASKYSRVLVDGTWDNANYWYRYALVRNALGLSHATEIGLIGRWRRGQVGRAFRIFGIGRMNAALTYQVANEDLAEARRLLRNVATPEDVTKLRLPEDFPWQLFYDGVLKRQLRGNVDTQDEMLPYYLAELLASIRNAQRIFREGRFDLAVLSHCINFELGALAWQAVRENVPAIVLYGDFGLQRFIKINSAQDLFDYVNRPSRQQFEAMAQPFRQQLMDRGEAYLNRRFAGASGDMGAAFAYKANSKGVDKPAISAAFGWDSGKPLVAVYASNWFDFPHSCEMDNFIDYQEWISATLDEAEKTPQVNWLFKPHPCDNWYAAPNGPTVAELVNARNQPHIRVVPQDWNGLSLMHAIDGAITYLGSIGLELSSLGKPVLVADRGWYGDNGFAVFPGGRNDYLQALKSRWWEGHDGPQARKLALEFVGAYFCAPEWQGGLVLQDDSNQDAIFQTMPAFIERHQQAVKREIDTIRDWMEAPDRLYHTYKIVQEAASSNGAANERVAT